MKKLFVRLVPFLWFKLGLIHVWRLVPREARRRLGRSLLGDAAPRRGPLARARAPLLVCGVLRSTTAFGWVARSTHERALEAGLEAYAIDLSDTLARGSLAKADQFPQAPLTVVRGPGTLVIHFNPNWFAYIQGILPEGLFDHKYVIASCAWELERIPDNWVPWLDLVDELWVPSRFAAAAFENAGVRRPCLVVPPLLEGPAQLSVGRDRFGLAKRDFVVLTAFSFGSGLARKNPHAAIAAFQQAFAGTTDSVRLVLKVSDVDSSPEGWARFQETCSEDPRIVVVNEALDDPTMWGLIGACDVVLSLHRAEGFGMLPAEGMLLGKAVVATGWSGNLDFMRPDNTVLVPYDLVPVEDPEGLFEAHDLHWAEPDVAAAAASLRRLRDEPDWREALGARARHDIEGYLSERRAALIERLRQISATSGPERVGAEMLTRPLTR